LQGSSGSGPTALQKSLSINARRATLGTPNGGRTWWAHLEFTRINIKLIILRKKFEDAREAGGSFISSAW
jgi:hypothetical protein